MAVKLQDLAGSIDQNYFVQGLLLASQGSSLGEMWEKSVTCTRCLFANQCGYIYEIMKKRGKNPTCGQTVDILLGDLDPEDESISPMSEWEDEEDEEEE